jgi:hypothetical protein
MKSALPRYLEVLFTFFIVFLFTYTAAEKFIDMNAFRWALNRAYLVDPWAPQLAWIIPASECIAVLLLLASRYRYLGWWFTWYLMLAFTAYVVYGVVVGKPMPCACGGIISEMSWNQHVVFNTVVLGLITLVLWSHDYTKRFIAINRRRRTPV